MKKLVRNIIIILIIVVACIFIIKKTNVLRPLKNLFTSQPVTIDETPILIKQIRSIGQIITATSYDEVVVDSIETSKLSRTITAFNMFNPFPILPSGEKRLVLVAKGKVLAGINLNLLTDGSIKLAKDTVSLHLPSTQIIDAILNPSDFETFEETGTWTPNAVTAVKLKARQKVVDHALDNNIINKADNKARSVLEDFLHAAGFKVVLFI